jgi:1-acyl-sn-glycerol-3-phosphate acyltransferase
VRACAVTADEWTNEQEIAYVPALGNGMDDLEFLFLERDWEKDKNTVAHRCRFLTNTSARAHTHT